MSTTSHTDESREHSHGGFEDLQCWQACRELRLFIAKTVVPALPPEERYRLADQMLRAARSTTANLAEGHGRFHYADTANFCSHSRGSVQEVLDHLITANDEDLIADALLVRGRELVDTATRLINGYRAYLQRAKRDS